ncbi:TolC family outer membrane protein [Mameliella sp. MMSF_3552]|uniref:TolC family outer membrane protein n=2 Tax=Mameliella TaxID=1434019 RepID=UPI00353256C1
MGIAVLGRIRRTCIRGAAGIALVAAMATPSWSETLAEALTAAYMNSGLLEQNRATLRAADEDVAQALAELRPVLRWTGSIRREYGYSGSTNSFGFFVESGRINQTASINLIAEIVLYAGGRNKLGLDAAKEQVLATRAQLVAIEQQVLLRAVSAFMNIRRFAETTALRENNVRVIQQELRAARDRFEVGEVTRTDVALAEARLAQARAALAAAQGDLIVAGEEYLAAVGVKPRNLENPRSLPKLPASVAEAKKQALYQHPELISQQHSVTAAELAILIAKGAKKPTVSLEGSYGFTENFDNSSYSRGGSITLGASGPIYSGGGLDSAERQAVANRDAQRGRLHVVLAEIEQNVGQAYANLRVARANRTSFEEQVRAATVAFRGVREEAKLGARTTLDVLDAEQELLDARASLVGAQVDEAIASYQVLSSLGLLTAEALHLDVPSFDPSAYYNLVKKAPRNRSKQGAELDRVLKALGKE